MTPSARNQRLFGTDGIRAPFGAFPLNEPTVVQVGALAAKAATTENTPPRVFIAGDTRDSTPTLASWLREGIEAAGGSVSTGGTLPTPGVALIVREAGYDLGIAISASHNPWPDNGLKLFDREGFKWTVEAERALEAVLDSNTTPPPRDRDLEFRPVKVEAAEIYLSALRRSLPQNAPLDGLRLIIDCANGATSPYAAELFRSLGAEIVAMGDAPDGRNINLDCGSTHPEAMTRRTQAEEAHIGFAFDGDGDRVLFADETGTMRDGDALLYLWSTLLHERGELPGHRIVATTMSNIGLERALARHGIGVERCDVGDRVVVETMRRTGLRLGGEQSGHLIDLEHGSTGDGLLTALHLAHRVAISQREADRPLSELLSGFERYPQVLKNVRVSSKPPFEELPQVQAHAAQITRHLAEDGRLVLRYSGTEPLARVMIEGQDQDEIDALALELCQTIEEAIGIPS